MTRDPFLFDKTQPIFWSDDIWTGDPDGDTTLSFEDETWRVKKDIVIAHFPWIMAAIARAEPSQGEPAIICPQLPTQLWEDEPSFFTYVEMYFLAERFRLDGLRLAMAACVEELSRHVLALAGHHCARCRVSRERVEWEERQHLASFLDAVLVVETRPWSAKMVKAMYDAGDRMKARLVRLPAFREFVEKFPEGRGFARAIGVRKI
ncbi:uncharacterized protein B0H64DRAFT_428781 [Chaetomium fimeti]|uniref:Uncharacterized protein n=1 Tax=Chaetomium fimeti TaxID=1854472 RepID=A0AAE0HQD4_9PEZI|nr:hypothetical protein B0H64DRAFT_428781 [Chaetomium fimeti]